MDNQRPDYGRGPRVEDDFTHRLTPAKAASPKRLAAAMPMALAAILVIATVAFGANLLGPIIVPDETPTPVIVGDEPTPTPSAEVTPEPTPVPPVVTPEPTPVPPAVTPAPTPEPTLEPTPAGGLTLTAKLSGTKVVLTWSAYDGADFAYYKLVRSSDAQASWPLGPGDTLLAAISNQSTLTYIDSPPTGKTWSYQVFVVKSTEEGFVVIAATNLVTIAVPKPTPPPTQNCGITLTAAYNATEHAVKLHWTKYNCDLFEAYLPIRSESTSKPDGPLPVNGVDLLKEVTNVNSLSMSDGTVKPGHTYYFRVLVWNSQALCYGGTILARSNIVKIVIPAAAGPTPASS